MHDILKSLTAGDLSSIADVAKKENIAVERLARDIRSGRCIVLKNDRRPYAPCAIGDGASVKVNVNIGTSGINCSPETGIEKAKAAITNGADIASVSEILGHSDKAVTLRMYTHADQASMTRASNIFREAIKRKQA